MEEKAVKSTSGHNERIIENILGSVQRKGRWKHGLNEVKVGYRYINKGGARAQGHKKMYFKRSLKRKEG